MSTLNTIKTFVENNPNVSRTALMVVFYLAIFKAIDIFVKAGSMLYRKILKIFKKPIVETQKRYVMFFSSDKFKELSKYTNICTFLNDLREHYDAEEAKLLPMTIPIIRENVNELQIDQLSHKALCHILRAINNSCLGSLGLPDNIPKSLLELISKLNFNGVNTYDNR